MLSLLIMRCFRGLIVFLNYRIRFDRIIPNWSFVFVQIYRGEPFKLGRTDDRNSVILLR